MTAIYTSVKALENYVIVLKRSVRKYCPNQTVQLVAMRHTIKLQAPALIPFFILGFCFENKENQTREKLCKYFVFSK